MRQVRSRVPIEGVTASVQWAVVLEIRGEFGLARRPRCHRPTAHEAARAWAQWREEDSAARVILRSTTGEEVVAEVTPVAEDGRLVYDVAILDEPVQQFGPSVIPSVDAAETH